MIVVMTDDQGPRMMRALPGVRRQIGDRGATFRNAFASYPLCCPSRATFLTGQYAHNHGALGNTRQSGGAYGALRQPQRNLAAWLRASGYDTAFVGKWLNGLRVPRAAPPGWDRWAALVGRGGEGLSSYYDFDVFKPGAGSRHFGRAERDYQTDALTREYALPLIRSLEDDPDPLFLWLAYHPPHDGLGRDDAAGRRCARGAPDSRGADQSAIPSPRYARSFARRRVPKPPAFNERDLSDKPAHLARQPPLGPRDIERIDRDHRCGLAALLSVDDAVRAIVATLRGAGELDRTVLVFTSDQGLLAGEHRLRGKNHPYEEAIRVPLLIRAPGSPGGRMVRAPVVNADLAPTILDLAGAPMPPALARPLDGTSLAPALDRGGAREDRAVLIEGRDEPSPAGRGVKVRSYVGVRTRRYAYFERHRGRFESTREAIAARIGAGRVTDRELYDLRRDPSQLRSLAGVAAYARPRRGLARLLQRLEDCSGAGCVLGARLSGPRPSR